MSLLGFCSRDELFDKAEFEWVQDLKTRQEKITKNANEENNAKFQEYLESQKNFINKHALAVQQEKKLRKDHAALPKKLVPLENRGGEKTFNSKPIHTMLLLCVTLLVSALPR